MLTTKKFNFLMNFPKVDLLALDNYFLYCLLKVEKISKIKNEEYFFHYIYGAMENWKEKENKLSKTFEFQNFQEAFAFMTRVAFLAEQHAHHPNWSNVYNTVTIELTTHDAGNIVTEKDKQLAKAIDQIPFA